MRHRKHKKTFDRKKSPREAMLKNLVTSVILYERVRTTTAKAKAIRPQIERLVTLGRQNTVANRRQLLRLLYTKQAVDKVLEVLGPRYQQRTGGYLRISKLGSRAGDGADVAQIELV